MGQWILLEQNMGTCSRESCFLRNISLLWCIHPLIADWPIDRSTEEIRSFLDY